MRLNFFVSSDDESFDINTNDSIPNKDQIGFLTLCGFTIVILCIIHEAICRNFVPYYIETDVWEMDQFWKFFTTTMYDSSSYLNIGKIFLILYSITIPLIHYNKGSLNKSECFFEFIKTFFPSLFFLLYCIIIFDAFSMQPNALFLSIYMGILSLIAFFYINFEVTSFVIILLVTFITSTFTMMLNRILFWIFIGSFTTIGLMLTINVNWKKSISSRVSKRNNNEYKSISGDSFFTEYI
uniref:Transmembrane protein n=1 Tax=Strongyloides venezuelensis TaxID=75913 RepID=A0A0K0EVE2_STRVS